MDYNKKVDFQVLKTEVEALNLGKLKNFHSIGDDITIDFVTPLSSTDKLLIDNVVANHTPNYLAKDKKHMNETIDAKTANLISSGFTFKGSTFSLSDSAQKNWMALKLFELDLTFPISLSTIDDSEYTLAKTDLNAFVLTAIGVTQSYLDSGRAIKQLVNNALDEASLKQIKDKR